MPHRLTAHDFARQFGTTVDRLTAACRDAIAAGDFRYNPLSPIDREQLIRDILQRIDSGSFSLAGAAGKERWDKGWNDNLQALLASKGDISQLTPKYIRPGLPIRLNQDYVQPVDPDFELNWYRIFRTWLFDRFMKAYGTVYEFGCGSGHNLACLAQTYPDKTIWGLDWAAPSVAILDQLGQTYHWDIHGRLFDFFAPDKDFHLAPGSMVYTLGALEQTGTKFEAFLQYLLRESPALVVTVEPIVEWLDPTSLVDYLGIRFLEVRQYMKGFPARLQQLEREGKVEILFSHRSYLGSLYVEGYCQLIWRPTKP